MSLENQVSLKILTLTIDDISISMLFVIKFFCVLQLCHKPAISEGQDDKFICHKCASPKKSSEAKVI